jgi:hypothetical protein
MPTDTILVNNLSVATLLVPAGSGPTLVVNNGPGTLYTGDSNSIQWSDGQGVVPLAPGSYIAVSGENDFFGTPGVSSSSIGFAQSPVMISQSLSGNFANPTTPGNCVVVGVFALNGSGLPPSVSGVTLGGSAGNFEQLAWYELGLGGGNTVLASLWADYDCAGGQTAVAVSGMNLSASFYSIVIAEAYGLITANPLDQISENGVTTANWTSGLSPETTAPGELWVAAVASSESFSVLPASPWSNLVASGPSFAFGSQVTSALGQAQYAGTVSGAGQPTAAVVATLKGASGTLQASPCNVVTVAGGLSYFHPGQ